MIVVCRCAQVCLHVDATLILQAAMPVWQGPCGWRLTCTIAHSVMYQSSPFGCITDATGATQLCQSWPFIHAAEASLLSVASCVIIIMWPQHDIYHSYRMSSGTAEACTRFASYWTLDQLQKPRIEHSWLCASSQNKKQAVWPSCTQVSR